MAIDTALARVWARAAAVKAAPRAGHPSRVGVTGALADGTGAITGSIEVSKFAALGSQLLATGTFTGTAADDTGHILAFGTQTITMLVDLGDSSGSCDSLHLALGPLDLSLLGVRAHLNQVGLDIGAQRGPGNLLGNLLCAVAHLLESDTGLNSVVSHLSRLLNLVLEVLG
ncbi:MAG: hypothetical protein ABIQ09_15670 [Jatrophihabitantaceae bacterium]